MSFWLAPGQTQPVTIQFKPASIGTAQGNLVIAMVEPVGHRIDQRVGIGEVVTKRAQPSVRDPAIGGDRCGERLNVAST